MTFPLMPFSFMGVSESAGTTIDLTPNSTDFPDGSFSGGDLLLVDAGAHSKAVDSAKQYASATPEMVVTNPVEFTSIGGSASSPTMQHASADMINVGDELWFKPSGSNALTAVEAGGVVESGGGPYTYTLSSLTPAQAVLPEKVFKIRNSSTAMMYLASGATNEVLCKDTALTLKAGQSTTSQVVTEQATSLLPYFNSTDLNKTLSLTLNGVATDVDWTGTVGEGSANGTCLDNSTGSFTARYFGNNSLQSYHGQSFTATAAWTLKTVKINQPYINGAGINRTVTCNVYADSSGHPSGSSLGSATLASMTAVQDYTFTFASPITLTQGNKYWYVLSCSVDGTNYGSINWTASGGNYSGGGAGDSSTATGISEGTQDDYFVLTADNAAYTTTIPIPTQASAPTAAKLADRFTTSVDISGCTYASGPLVTVTGVKSSFSNVPTRKRIALKLRDDTALGLKADTIKIYNTVR